MSNDTHIYIYICIFNNRKQREVTNKEAMELDEEMERMQSHTQYKLEEQVCYQFTYHIF